MFMSLLFMLKAHIEFKRNFAKNNTNSEREYTECQGGLSFSLWSVESYIYLVVCKVGALQIDQSLQPYKHGIPSTVEHPHQVELIISIQLHSC